MQGDIYQLESMTFPQVAVPKPKPQPLAMPSKSISDPHVAIYNEDDLSHLLYVENDRHRHHHHHHHHAHIDEQGLFVHPADTGIVLINNTLTNDDDNTEPSTPTLSDCSESFFGSEILGVATTTEPQCQSSNGTIPVDTDANALEAYRRKGRRNAVCADSFVFPIFLGRQDEEVTYDEEATDEEEEAEEEWHAIPPPATAVPMSRHVDAIAGPLMSWWPAPEGVEEEHDWVSSFVGMEEKEKEKDQDEQKHEKEQKLTGEDDGGYDVRHVADIEGPLMSWWPAPLNAAEYVWSERFYE